MRKNDLIQTECSVLRILAIDKGRVLTIDCLKRNMPKWYPTECISGEPITEQDLSDLSDAEIYDIDSLDIATRKIVHDRYTIIAGVLPFLTDEKMRSAVISRIADEHEICKQTVRNYLCLYLAFQNISALAPKRIEDERPLSKDEKNMRWALNKFFYTKNQNSLPTAYTMMLKEKYSDEAGTLLPDFPTFNQFRYFYRKHKKLQTYYISRNGIKSYQRNKRPLIGDGVREFASAVGVGMLDSTICDIYLVDEANNLNITVMPESENEFLFIDACGHDICASHGDLDTVKTSPRLLTTVFQKKYGNTHIVRTMRQDSKRKTIMEPVYRN